MFTSQSVLLTQTAGKTLTTIKYIVLKLKETTRDAYVKRPESIQLQSWIVRLIPTLQPLSSTYEMSKKKGLEQKNNKPIVVVLSFFQLINVMFPQ